MWDLDTIVKMNQESAESHERALEADVELSNRIFALIHDYVNTAKEPLGVLDQFALANLITEEVTQ